MPRSKNPNPRQVTDGEVNGDLQDAAGQESPTENNDEPLLSEANIADATETEENKVEELSPTIANEDWTLSAVIPPTDTDGDAYFTPPTAISTLQFASLPTACAEEEETVITKANVASKQLAVYSRPGESKKSKAQIANVFNPQVMTWMKNRFEMGTGGKISASDVSNLYRKDTEHMENPPPGLQNYQVGQLLRRVFPEITRCKITVDGRRYWVYKHLTLIKNPPDNLFEDRPTKSSLLSERMDRDIHRFDGIGTSGSPSSIGDEAYVDRDDSDNELSKVNMADTKFANDKEKQNALLLGLLGRERAMGSPVEDAISYHNGLGMGKKKRDSEVIDWLRASYKYKPGYYVKSMDLLRQYNNGRVEIVKYLSQVGRVMKHVFPEVRHLRKSFKGGKREWVYLNLKPIAVDSDSEEGKSMVMPTMRRATGWYQGQDSFDLHKNSTGWKRERVDISHTPLSLVRPDSVFNRHDEVFHGKHYPNDNTALIKKNLYDDVPSLLHWAKQHGFGNDVDVNEVGSSENEDSNGVKINEVTDTDSDKMKDSNDVFATFSQMDNIDTDALMEAKRIKLSRPPSSTMLNVSNAANRGITTTKTTMLAKPPSLLLPQQRRMNVVSDNNSPALDLTVKGSTNGASSFREKIDQLLSIPGSPVDATGMDIQPDFSLAAKLKQAAFGGAAAAPVMLPSRGSNPTIHYHPPHIPRSGAGYLQNNAESSNTSTSGNQQYQGVKSTTEENLISWLTLQAFNAHPYGWMKSPVIPRWDSKDGKQSRYLEWFSFCGQSLVNKQRALKEVKIYEDWTVEIYALGRRVFPNDLGGITDLDKTTDSLNKVFRVLAEAKICTGFPAPSVNDMYIHGVLVSRCEVWSTRDSPNEDLRQRAVNCQMMFSSPDPCCSKCSRIMMLHQRPGKTFSSGNKNITDSNDGDGRGK